MKETKSLQANKILTLGLLSVSILFHSPAMLAQTGSKSPDKLWEALDKDKNSVAVGQLNSLTQIPKVFQIFRLNQGRMTTLLKSSQTSLTANTSCSGLVLTLPMPDQTYKRFCVRESSIMEPDLAAAFPDIKTYQGQGIDDPTMTVRFDRTFRGLHAIVLTPDRTFYIDPFPLRKGDLATYISYFDKDSQQKAFQCLVQYDSAAKRNLPAGNFTELPIINN